MWQAADETEAETEALLTRGRHRIVLASASKHGSLFTHRIVHGLVHLLENAKSTPGRTCGFPRMLPTHTVCWVM